MAGGRLRIVCGPTAAGKSALALELAESHGAAIISADSRQIYRGFDIGTAKPARAERARVAHFGLDVADPAERYSAVRWAEAAARWIEDAARAGRTPVIVGGTGLYVKALVEPLFAMPPLEAARREALSAALEPMPADELRRWCRELDPRRAHLGRTQLLRAIETALLSGARMSELHAAHNARAAAQAHRIDPVYLVIDPGPSLGGRIASRVEAMLAAGWADEVERLSRAVAPAAPAWKASGYVTMRRYIEGTLDLSSARERVIIETRQYAKRQRTWFRHQLPSAAVTHLNSDDSGALTLAREWWEKGE